MLYGAIQLALITGIMCLSLRCIDKQKFEMYVVVDANALDQSGSRSGRHLSYLWLWLCPADEWQQVHAIENK
jgi:hypothetical protein